MHQQYPLRGSELQKTALTRICTTPTCASKKQAVLLDQYFFFCSNALIALARSLCKCLLAVLIIASGADTVKGYLVRCACIDDTIP